VTPLFSWIKIAYAEVGTKEYVGIADNPRVVEYHSTTSLHATDDEVPWCSSFVNWVMCKAGYPHTDSARARSWIEYGTKITEPIRGCIVILTRTGGGHVGFYESHVDEDTIRVFGGNQSDAVNYRQYPTSRVICYVMPSVLKAKDVTIQGLILNG